VGWLWFVIVGCLGISMKVEKIPFFKHKLTLFIKKKKKKKNLVLVGFRYKDQNDT